MSLFVVVVAAAVNLSAGTSSLQVIVGVMNH